MSLQAWEVTAYIVLGYGLCIGVYELLFWWHETGRPAIERVNARHDDAHRRDLQRQIAAWHGRDLP
jgi:hypothetical protein